MSGYVSCRVDRNFLYLSAIYAIHGILLHVFLQPINVESVSISSNFLSKQNVIEKNSTYHEIELNNNYQVEKNTSDNLPMIVNDNIVLTQQAEYNEVGHRFLTASTTSQSSFIVALATCTSMTMPVLTSISPSTWGIISGCIVFFLTFTEDEVIR